MNPLDKVKEALDDVHKWQPACYVWKVQQFEEIVLDRTDVNPHFANQLIPLYTRDQVYKLLGIEDDEE